MWGVIYSCAMRTVPTSCHVLLQCSYIMRTLHGAHMQASRPPLYKRGMPEITYGHAMHTSQMIFIKNNHFTF